jgi:hypothetical protein
MNEKVITWTIRPCDYLETAVKRIFNGFSVWGWRLLLIISGVPRARNGWFLLGQSYILYFNNNIKYYYYYKIFTYGAGSVSLYT